MQPIKLFYFLWPFLAAAQTITKTSEKDTFFICYGKIAPEKVFGYDLVILEPQLYTVVEILEFKRRNQKVIGYISLTEVHPSANLYLPIKEYSFGENATWGSSYIAINKPMAQEIILKEVANIMSKGFDGLFMDNLDNASEWGVLREHKTSLVELIHKIKKKHSNAYLMQNSGLFLAEDLNEVSHSILVESVVTAYNFRDKQYAFRKKEETNQRLLELTKLKAQLKKPIYILEYADTTSMKIMVEDALASTKFSVEVAQIDLQNIPVFTSKNN